MLITISIPCTHTLAISYVVVISGKYFKDSSVDQTGLYDWICHFLRLLLCGSQIIYLPNIFKDFIEINFQINQLATLHIKYPTVHFRAALRKK
jgi:hypothetical protein